MDFESIVQEKYSHLNAKDVKSVVDKAKMFYYSLRYPCEPNASEQTRPINSFKHQQWIIMACDDIIARYGINNVIGYRENGVSFTFDGAEISERLISMIKPIIGVI